VHKVILSTAYLPPISWLAAAIQSKAVEIEFFETYPKQTYRNRCIIAVSGGILNLTVPVIRADGNHTITGNVGIDNSTKWQQLHWRSIVTAYSKAPYFLYYRDLFEPLYHKPFTKLIDLNREILSIVFKSLNISNLHIALSKQYEFTPVYPDLRNSFHPKKRLIKEEDTHSERYIQVFEEINGFIPDLSCIDLLFNLGPDAAAYLARVKPIPGE